MPPREREREPEHDLGPAELEVLTILWDEGPSTVREVLTHLHRRGRTVAYTTVLTFLTRLAQKGYVVSDKSDLAHVYRAAVPRDTVRHSRLKALIDELYDGSACPLVLQLMQTGTFTPEEVAQLQSLIDRLDEQTKRRKKGRGG
ncbi:MAG: BlaI/MecI/CopY family transcriptional regulator [Phycisphaeraceae bacterium]|nr:BlaI/MecI/CopY family transcriptional regulator [Phycisphaerales bacterium]QOJ17042.1 MAG: BlaI/MecI/CopY family transcriptional regulator [Phycisphaeraceae bacterium]